MERAKQRFTLRKILERHGFTQAYVCKTLNKPRSTVSRWFSGQQEPKTMADKRRLCTLLKVSVDDVKWGSEE